MAKPVILAVDDDPQVLRADSGESAPDKLPNDDPVPLSLVTRSAHRRRPQEVTFDSKPGETRFAVRLPLKGRNTEGG